MIPKHTNCTILSTLNDADTFTSAFGISMTYSHSNSQPLCPTNGEQPKPFSVTLHNFNASLKELLVICGIRRIQCLSSSHAISLFARLKLDTSPTTGITHHASISLLDPSITSFLMQNLQLHLLLKLAVQLRPTTGNNCYASISLLNLSIASFLTQNRYLQLHLLLKLTPQ